MNEEINKTYNSLPEEEKEKLNRFEKKGITRITKKVDQQTGEILSTETSYNSETRRVKGSFCQTSPDKLIEMCSLVKNRAINKMLAYIIGTCNYKNEFTFDKTFIESYGTDNKQRFFTDRKYLLDNKYIFIKPNKKNIYTLDIALMSRCSIDIASQIYKEQYGEEFNQNSKAELAKMLKNCAPKMTKEDKEELKKIIDQII